MTLDPPVVLFEDLGLLALAKPAGLHVFGRDSVCQWLICARPGLSQVGPSAQPAIVHRLDRDTSGLLLAASQTGTYDRLRAAFAAGRVVKDYLAVVEGRLESAQTIDAPLGGRYRRSRRVRVAGKERGLRGVRPARSQVEPMGCGPDVSLCRVRILSGMRHQIRAHLAHVGHPLVGDRLYGAQAGRTGPDNLAFGLHAWAAGLPAEVIGDPLELVCPLPAALVDWLVRLGLAAPKW